MFAQEFRQVKKTIDKMTASTAKFGAGTIFSAHSQVNRQPCRSVQGLNFVPCVFAGGLKLLGQSSLFPIATTAKRERKAGGEHT
jgi:hypothetical protein